MPSIDPIPGACHIGRISIQGGLYVTDNEPIERNAPESEPEPVRRVWRTPRVITSTITNSTTEVSTLLAIADGGFASVYS